MNFVVGTLGLTTVGGVGTYAVTVSEQLQRISHGVTIIARDDLPGPVLSAPAG